MKYDDQSRGLYHSYLENLAHFRITEGNPSYILDSHPQRPSHFIMEYIPYLDFIRRVISTNYFNQITGMNMWSIGTSLIQLFLDCIDLDFSSILGTQDHNDPSSFLLHRQPPHHPPLAAFTEMDFKSVDPENVFSFNSFLPFLAAQTTLNSRPCITKHTSTNQSTPMSSRIRTPIKTGQRRPNLSSSSPFNSNLSQHSFSRGDNSFFSEPLPDLLIQNETTYFSRDTVLILDFVSDLLSDVNFHRFLMHFSERVVDKRYVTFLIQ
jgi:hypothetical protein